MTTTSNISVVDRLSAFSDPDGIALASLLGAAIADYSQKNGKPYEEVNGLRALAAPVGSRSFTNQFLSTMVNGAVTASQAITSGLESSQTILQLFRSSMAHNLTHLFTSDVLNHDEADLPRLEHWNCWESDLTDSFGAMVDTILATLTQRTSMPTHTSPSAP